MLNPTLVSAVEVIMERASTQATHWLLLFFSTYYLQPCCSTDAEGRTFLFKPSSLLRGKTMTVNCINQNVPLKLDGEGTRIFVMDFRGNSASARGRPELCPLTLRVTGE